MLVPKSMDSATRKAELIEDRRQHLLHSIFLRSGRDLLANDPYQASGKGSHIKLVILTVGSVQNCAYY